MTPVFVRFLSTTLLNHVNKVLESYLRGDRPHREASLPGSSEPARLDPAAQSKHGVAAAVARSEEQQVMRAAIDGLDEADREVVVLRGIEQLSNNKVAEVLGVQPSAVSMRYHKALEKLRVALPDSVFVDLPDD